VRSQAAHPWPGGAVTFTFDDGLLSQFDHGLPAFQQHGIAGVAFIPTGLVGGWFEGQATMSLGHLRELQRAGWEVGSHTVSHPQLTKSGQSRLPSAALEAELGESARWLTERGLAVRSLAYPAGRYNHEIATAAGRWYRYGRTTEGGLNDFSSADLTLRSFNLGHASVERWRQEVKEAAATGRWLVATAHVVVESADQIPPGHESRCIDRHALSECVGVALGAGLRAVTFADVLEACFDLPSSGTAGPEERPATPAGVQITVRIRGAKARVAIKDERRGFGLRYRCGAAPRQAILTDLWRRAGADLELSPADVERIAEFR
jgi:peptidoglycan/xylan/chitin deacetylase (PgdA/CDA1 family)